MDFNMICSDGFVIHLVHIHTLIDCLDLYMNMLECYVFLIWMDVIACYVMLVCCALMWFASVLDVSEDRLVNLANQRQNWSKLDKTWRRGSRVYRGLRA